MGRAIVLVASLGALSAGLAGCGSMPSLSQAFGPGGGFLSSEPPSVTVQLDSRPAGAQATTSVGPSCRTPCTLQVPTQQPFSVTFTLDRYTPQTIPVEMVSEGAMELDDYGEPKRLMGEIKPSPNPVFAALEPARGKAPPKRQQAAAPPKAPKAAAKSAPPPNSGFPPPPSSGSAFPTR